MKTIRDEPFHTMFDQYCARRSIDPSTVHFLLNGQKIDLGTSPADAGLVTLTRSLPLLAIFVSVLRDSLLRG